MLQQTIFFLINILLPGLLKSCQIRFLSLIFPGVQNRKLGFGTCVHTVTVLMAETAYHTPSSPWSSHHCTTLLHPALPIYTIWVRKQQEVQERVRSGWATFHHFSFVPPASLCAEESSPLDGTCLGIFLSFLKADVSLRDDVWERNYIFISRHVAWII